MKFKKIFTFLLIFFAGIALVGCNEDTPPTESLPPGTDGSSLEDVVKTAFLESKLIGLENNESLSQITENFKVVTKIVGHEIEWMATNDVVTFDGDDVIIERGERNIEVKLIAILTLENNEEVKRNFDLVIIDIYGGIGMDLRRGTFDRAYPTYYELGVPLIEDAHVIYINWDGFAQYYLDEFFETEAGKNSTLYQLKDEGVYFDNLRNTFPSVTNPVQNQILSGGTSLLTGNIYRYYDKKTNQVIQQQRENNAPILSEITVGAGISTVSVHMYLSEPHLTSTDINKLYVTADSSNPKVQARGSARSGDHFSRMEQVIKMIKGEPVMVGGTPFTFNKMPEFTLIYADDLDAVGHNHVIDTGVTGYGYPLAISEDQRRENIQTLLLEMDQKLGEMIEAAKARGIYDDLTFFLTTDHGMSPFGSRGPEEYKDYGKSRLPMLKEDILSYNSNYKLERVQAGDPVPETATIVGVSGNLNMFMTFKEDISDAELDNFKAYLQTLPYVYEVYTRQDLIDNYMDIKDVDILVVPEAHYSFSMVSPAQVLPPRGQHDTTLDTSNHVIGMIWGKGIKKGYVFQGQAFNYDFGITMAAVLGVDLPLANGIVLDIFERD